MNTKGFTTLELLLARQFLTSFADSLSLKKEFVRDASLQLQDVDKELWARLISDNTPWGNCAETQLVFEDENFTQTLAEIKENMDVNE